MPSIPASSILDPLEPRTLFSVSAADAAVIVPPADVVVDRAQRARAVGYTSALTMGDRYQLLRQWAGPGKSQLQQYLDQNKAGAFDRMLLDYMINRTSVSYYYDVADVPAYADFLNTKMYSCLKR